MRLRLLPNILGFVATFVASTLVGVNSAATARDAGAQAFDHVYIIVLENHDFDAALYLGASPFLLSLSRAQGLATRYSGVTHPSLPNYIAMIAGDKFGIRDDAPSCFASDLRPGQSCHRLVGDSLVDQLEAAGLDWALYAETLPATGALTQTFPDNGPKALYAQKHNPFAYFEQIAANPARLNRLKPLESLADDLSGKAPNFAFIVPNQCHDGHGLVTCNNPVSLTRDFDAVVEQTVGMRGIRPSSSLLTKGRKRPLRRLPPLRLIGTP
jgi:phosphatidylinositol-3-phosphatase